jgi:spermidine synthase
MSSKPTPKAVAALLFSSGFCALIYQTVWLREFRLIFGASTAASAAVFGIFMGGLGLGSAFLGRRAEASRNPLLMYGNLEVGIALLAAISPGLVLAVRSLYAATGGTMVLGDVSGTVVRLIMAALVLIGPTFLMGGTLPAAAKSVASDDDVSRRSLALLYGANTMGAVTGTLVSTFWLMETLGNRTALWIGCGLNVVVAMVARSISRRSEASPQARTEEACDIQVADVEPQKHRLVIFASAIVGFAFMLMELVWYRMLGPILGGTTFTFGLILAVALFGIGLGGLAYTLRGQNRPVTLNGFALACALESIFIVIPYALGDRLAYLALLVRQFGTLGFAAQIVGWAILTAIVVLPAAFVAGYQFPLLIALLGRGRSGVARHAGVAYASNTFGAFIGSLAGGFGLMPLITAPGLWKLVTLMLAVLAVVAAIGDKAAGRFKLRFSHAVALAAIALIFTEGPTALWRHGGIGAGRSDKSFKSRNELLSLRNAHLRATVWEAEGLESSVALQAGSGLAFVVNGKIDGHALGDAGTQVMGGVLPAILHPQPRKALVIGLGTGSSAGWLAALPEMERVDVVELEPAILEVARRCSAVNHDVMANPKVRIHLGDAREVLITTPERYDIIVSEPSNPYRAGIASLFTYDFYQSAKLRLNPGGIFAQWTQAYEINSDTLQTVFATVSKSFGHVQTWRTKTSDLMLIASDQPVVIDAELLRQRTSSQAMKSALFNAWRVSSIEGILAHFVANEDLMRMALESDQEIATDDRNPLEYGFARGIGREKSGNVETQLLEYSRAKKCDRPKVVRGDIQWDRVEELAPLLYAIDRMPAPAVAAESPGRTNWRNFATLYCQNEHEKAMQFANAKKLQAVDAMQIEMLAECAVFSKDPSAEEWIEKCAQLHPLSGTALRACLAAVRADAAGATEGLVKTFEGCRVDPWVRFTFMQHLFEMARFVADNSKDQAVARRLCDGLSQPFAVESMRDYRQGIRLELAKKTENYRFNPQFRAASEPFAAHPIWKEPFLKERVMAYRAWNDPRLIEAADDLRRFLDNRSPGFGETFRAATPAPLQAEKKNADSKAVVNDGILAKAPQ